MRTSQPQQDPTHSANFGLKLKERCEAVGVHCELAYPGAAGVENGREEGETLFNPLSPRRGHGVRWLGRAGSEWEKCEGEDGCQTETPCKAGIKKTVHERGAKGRLLLREDPATLNRPPRPDNQTCRRRRTHK